MSHRQRVALAFIPTLGDGGPLPGHGATGTGTMVAAAAPGATLVIEGLRPSGTVSVTGQWLNLGLANVGERRSGLPRRGFRFQD